MKKKTKTIISLILVVSILSTITYMGFNTFGATSGYLEEQGLRWHLSDDGVFTVTGNGYGSDYATAITVPWRTSKSSIKKVIVEEGVQAIGNYWFYGCSNLESVELPDSMYKIGARCFQSCTSLKSITIPENCCEYYNYLFSGCTSLKWVVLPSDNTSENYKHTIPDYTFNGCSSLENVWVGSGYTSISSTAFRNCSNLSAVIWCGNTLSSASSFPSGAVIVGKSALESQCNSISVNFVNIEGSSSYTLNYAFDLTTKKLSITGNGDMDSAPWDKWKYFIFGVELESPTSICADAFKGCENIGEEFTVPKSVTSIASNAFSDSGVTYFMIKSDNISIADNAFDGNDNIFFFGKRNSGVYSFVQGKQSANSGWKYYCLEPHSFTSNGSKCAFCDKVDGALTIDALGSHNYVYQYRLGDTLYYKCSECENDDYSVNIRDLMLNFNDAASPKATAYQSGVYDGRFDVKRDGIVNGKDYALLEFMLENEKTEYDRNLTNENATKEAKKLYRYISDTYGNKIISGQQESHWISENYEFDYIYTKTGKYPAIRGFDFMDDDFNGVVSRAKKWAAKGGIVTICWHCSKNFDLSYDACKADELTSDEWEAILTEGTTENARILAAMDKAGNALLQLQNEGIPVLWRPFHEFDGGWFWWGKGGSDYFKRLWIMMYNHFTYDLGLNNLIWVLGYSHNADDYGTNLADWYPGNRYCDIVGADSYEVRENKAEARLYKPVYRIVNGAKPLVMHETGLIPEVADFEGVKWTYFMTWHTTYLTDENSDELLNSVYNSDYVITLDEVENIYS